MKNKITKLSDLTQQIDGKLHENEGESKASFVPTRLDQILSGNNVFNRYATLNEDAYLKEIEGMNLAELRTHAVKLGAFVPSSNRERLLKQLRAEFHKYTTNLKGRPDFSDSNLKLNNNKLKAGMDIMRAVK